MREDLYHAIKDYQAKALMDKSWDAVDAESKRYVTKVLDDFETGGMKLNAEQRHHLVAIQNQIHDLESKATANIAADKSKVPVNITDLKGLDEKQI